MDLLAGLIDIFLHLDKHLAAVIGEYGLWTYLILFLIVFCETGLVVTPFLPGDSLLFAAGAFAATGALDPLALFALLNVAAVGGNSLNYQIGYLVGPRVFRQRSRLFKMEHLVRTQVFYEKYGPMTIVIARFLPIIRTFAPFLAGIGKMSRFRFAAYSVAGSAAWVTLFTLGGYFFGNIPVVKKNFTIAIMTIIIISVLPTIIAVIRRPRRSA
jgi:membrane-associated protein